MFNSNRKDPGYCCLGATNICEASLTSTENAVEVYFDSSHHSCEEVWPGKNIPSMGNMRGWTAAGQDLNLQSRGGDNIHNNTPVL